MFRSNLVFVVGAGASVEVGLPVGDGLKKDIVHRLSIWFDWPDGQTEGDRQIAAAIQEHARINSGPESDTEAYFQVCAQIVDSLQHSVSIDEYIYVHSENDKIELCAKLAIVKSILEAEKDSHLYLDPDSRNNILSSKIEETWYSPFFRLLLENVRKEDIRGVFEGVSFIVFNYDRCIEHYLFHAVKTKYGLSSEDTSDILRTLKVIHPYGTVGFLPSQKEEDVTVPFGSPTMRDGGRQLLALAGQIRTYTQQTSDKPALKEMRQLVRDADVIVFLGFGFHPQNMELLAQDERIKHKRIFATAHEVSQEDQEVITSVLANRLNQERRQIRVADRSCYGLFNDYWHTFRNL